MREYPTLDELLPTLDEANDPREDFRRMAEGIEIAEWALRIGEFAEFDSIEIQHRRYSIRVNGREHEPPHVDIRFGHVHVRIFLGRTPHDVAPDRSARRTFKQQIRNRRTRHLLLEYVRTHHSCLLAAWRETGNPLHDPDGEFSVTCERHGLSGPEEVRQRGGFSLKGERLNAHLDEANAYLRRRHDVRRAPEKQPPT